MFQGNEQPKSRWGRLKERLKHTYRLVIMNDETFEEVGSYRINLLNFYVLISTELVIVFLFVFFVLAYTPIKRYLPGFTTDTKQYEMQELEDQIKTLEEDLENYKLYTESVKKALVGDMTGLRIEDVPAVTAQEDSFINVVEPIELEEQLREETELDQIGELAKQSKRANFLKQGIPLEQLYFTAPVNGEVSAGFEPDAKHYGVDILAPKNTAIKATMDGYVFLSDWTLETGNTIGIQHSNNIVTFYKHNSMLLKKAGNFVKAGEAVAIIGNTGTLTDGPHLHFELWYQGKAVDPTEYVRF